MKKKILFIDRDGTLIQEFPPTYQIDSFDKLSFYPEVFLYMGKIAREFDYELVLVSNQDGMGTDVFPAESFWPVHNLIMGSFANENVIFSDELIDVSFPSDNLPTRKPGIGMFGKYLNSEEYDIPSSYVIGDRVTDVQLAKNLGCKALWLKNNPDLGGAEVTDSEDALKSSIALSTQHWKDIYEYLKLSKRTALQTRSTNETHIRIEIDLDGSGSSRINTGLPFFDHMLDQLSRHGSMNLAIDVKGDLEIDQHHTIEDTALALGEAFLKSLGDKAGIGRYGFALPMDESEAKVLIDFGGRPWLVWNVDFSGAEIGGVPVEMFYHFFKSFSDAARCNLNIESKGSNDHHRIEAIFKAFAKAIKMAVRRDPANMSLPSTKGVL